MVIPTPFALTGTLREYSSPELHRHTRHQFLTIPKGVSLLETPQHRQPFYGSLVAFIPAGCPHRSLALGSSITYQSLYLPSEAFPDAAPEICVFEGSFLANALLERLSTAHFQEPLPPLLQHALGLFLGVVREDMSTQTFHFRLPRPTTESGQRIVAYLEDHFQESLTLECLQRHLPHSARQLTRLFTGDLGITPLHYLRLYRLYQASIQLRNTTLGILEIAQDCGYASLSNFYADWRKCLGGTPRGFREGSLRA